MLEYRPIPEQFTQTARRIGLLTFFMALAADVVGNEPATVRLVDLRLDATFAQHMVPVAGGQLSCYRRAGNGPALLLIPGTFSDVRVYTMTVHSIDPSYDLILVENRGLGGSWPPPGQSSIEDCATDAIAVLDTLKISSCYVGGHSLGGMISLELGQRIPERILGVISIEGWTNDTAAKEAFQSDMKSTLSPQQLAFMDEYRSEVLRRWSPEQIKMFSSIWRKWDGSEFLKTTKLPVLELYGDRGKPRPASEQLGIPVRDNIQLVWFAGASHSLLIERSEEVAREINRFVAASQHTR